MSPFEFLKLALIAITRNKMRAFLTMLGIIIGVGSVIAMIGIGEGSKRASAAVIQNMGSNMLMIFNGGSSRNPMGPVGMGSVEVLKDDHADAINRELTAAGAVVAATPSVRTSQPAVYQNNNWRVGDVRGAGVQFLQIRGWDLAQGRFFNDQEVRSQAKVCVLGRTVVENLFPGGEDPVGKIIRVGKLPFEVIGVLERKGGGMMGDQDDTIVAPYTTVMRKLMGRDRIGMIMVSAQEGRTAQAEQEITGLMRQMLRLGPQDDLPFTIRKQDDWLQMAARQSDVLTMFLAVAAAISLVVGGIGISNIMLVSVTERTREIGVRRAMGATQHSIMMQFLVEAVALSLLGGLLGVCMACSVIWLLKTFTTLPAVTESWAVVMGLGFSGLVGVMAGFLPAVKAAKLDVIDALRYE